MVRSDNIRSFYRLCPKYNAKKGVFTLKNKTKKIILR